MSSKSKKPPRRQSTQDIINRCLLMFTWAWVSTCHPTQEQMSAVQAEIFNVAGSFAAGTLNERAIVEALRDEYGCETDWERRSRGR